ncbi:YfcE family phosphodiesterase [Archaeoglobales archaeon]|nr:MAG: YfcE family phosphodiesterase [Archaeoglobales archaeon]
MNVLVIGDTHIPRRALSLPKKISEFIESKLFDLIICTGDLTERDVLEYFETLAKVVVVRGNMDHLGLPDYSELKVEDVKVGVIHGHQVYPRGNREKLVEIGKQKSVDVLISGHTHTPDIYMEDVLLLNPGSATGVWGGGGGSMKPSFIVLNVEGRKVDVKLYELERELSVRSERFYLK